MTKKKIEHIILVMEDPFSDRLGMATNRQERLPRIGCLKKARMSIMLVRALLFYTTSPLDPFGWDLFCATALKIRLAASTALLTW